MKDLIEALTIFLKYGNPHAPTHCEHDELLVDIKYEDVSAEDREKLEALSFHHCEEHGCFRSFRFGSF
jgi:hypothetical protein